MIAADQPVQRPPTRSCSSSTRRAASRSVPRTRSSSCCGPGDLVVANDAATLPASLRGVHVPTGAAIEVRLAGARFARARRRAAFPRDRVRRGRLSHAHRGSAAAAAARAGRPPAARPADGDRRSSAARPSAAGRAALRRSAARDLGRARAARPADPVRARAAGRWRCGTSGRRSPARRSPSSRRRPASCSTGSCSRRFAARGIGFATITHAAGISSTGDPRARSPLAVRRAVSHSGGDRAGDRARARARAAASSRSARPSCARSSTRRRATARVVAGDGVATSASAAHTRLRVVDAILSGTHEPGTSHYELLRAFADDATLRRADRGARRAAATARTSSAIPC